MTGNSNSSPSVVSVLGSTPTTFNSEDATQGLENDMTEQYEANIGIEELLAAHRTEFLLSYCNMLHIYFSRRLLTSADDVHVCPTIAVIQTGLNNPFREYVVSRTLLLRNSSDKLASTGLRACWTTSCNTRFSIMSYEHHHWN